MVPAEPGNMASRQALERSDSSSLRRVPAYALPMSHEEAPPGMVGEPSAARPAVPPDAADHAEDFSWRYAEDLDIVAGQAMIDLGVPDDQMGAGDPRRLGEHHSFHPGDRTGGSNGPVGQITVDSGIMNPQLFDQNYDEETQHLWRKARLKHRVEAIIAHEYEEYYHGSDHAVALKHAPTTALPISDRRESFAGRCRRDGTGGRHVKTL